MIASRIIGGEASSLLRRIRGRASTRPAALTQLVDDEPRHRDHRGDRKKNDGHPQDGYLQHADNVGGGHIAYLPIPLRRGDRLRVDVAPGRSPRVLRQQCGRPGCRVRFLPASTATPPAGACERAGSFISPIGRDRHRAAARFAR